MTILDRERRILIIIIFFFTCLDVQLGQAIGFQRLNSEILLIF